MVMPKKPLESNKFGRLTILCSVIGGWSCVCDCGKKLVVTGNRLRRGAVTSCGCYHAQIIKAGANRSHGKTNTQVYRIWAGMLARCTNPKHRSWNDYGGRGICVSAEWQRFENFFRDMGEPQPCDTIERIDVNGNYEKNNCIWIPKSQQGFNTRRSRLITLDGVTKSLVQWCVDKNLRYYTVHARLRRGRSHEEALQS